MSSALVPVTAQWIPSPEVSPRSAHPLPSNPKKSIRFFQWSVSRVSIGAQQKSRYSNSLRSKNDSREVPNYGDLDECSTDPNGPERENGQQTAKGFSPKELMQGLKRYGVAGVLSYGLLNTIYYLTTFLLVWLMQGLKRYGVAGVLSYGLLNTIYYLTTFLLVWFYFAPAHGRMGYAAAVERFLKVMAMVWAGSQVTKIVRAGGALALAPFVDRGLSWFTIKFEFESKGKAFAAIAGMCFGLALLLFFGLTLLWA